MPTPLAPALLTPVLLTPVLLTLALAGGCTRPAAVQPYGRVSNGNQVRPLTAKEIALVDDFLKRHPTEPGILATPAPAVGASTDPSAARQSPRASDNPLTGPRRGE